MWRTGLAGTLFKDLLGGGGGDRSTRLQETASKCKQNGGWRGGRRGINAKENKDNTEKKRNVLRVHYLAQQ